MVFVFSLRFVLFFAFFSVLAFFVFCLVGWLVDLKSSLEGT